MIELLKLTGVSVSDERLTGSTDYFPSGQQQFGPVAIGNRTS